MKKLNESDNDFVCDIQAPCFQELMSEEMQFIKQNKTQVSFRKGENLTKQGAFASCILFILDGLVKQFLEIDTSKNLNVRLLQSGDFIGLTSVFSKPTYDISTIALRETKAYLVEKQAIETLIVQNGKFAKSIMQRHVEQESHIYTLLKNLQLKQMNGRLADILLYLSSPQFVGENVFSTLSRKDIAEFAGISTESAVKLLKTYEKENLIKLNDKEIEILNPVELSEISKRG